jgi:hypothetical protein
MQKSSPNVQPTQSVRSPGAMSPARGQAMRMWWERRENLLVLKLPSMPSGSLAANRPRMDAEAPPFCVAVETASKVWTVLSPTSYVRPLISTGRTLRREI